MVAIRRVYIYLVCTIALQALVWGMIALLQDALPIGAPAPVATLALEIAIVVVSLPIWLAHWTWAQRLAAQNELERDNLLRRVYLFGTRAIFLLALVFQTLDLLATLLRLGLGEPVFASSRAGEPAEGIAHAVVAIGVLVVFGTYHRRMTDRQAPAIAETGAAATVNRVYVLGFGAIGLTMTVYAFIQLLRWVLAHIGPPLVIGDVTTADELARLLVGAALWLFFWQRAQIHFQGPSREEHESGLRKFYLYLAIFSAAMGAVAATTDLIARLLFIALGLTTGGDLRNPFSVICGMVVTWAYHSRVLTDDARRVREGSRQAGIRRLYLYLIAGVGLAALLAGLVGQGNVLIRTLGGDSFGTGLRELLGWSTAAILVGLPVWLWPWRGLQTVAGEPGERGAEERRSIVRKFYLYFYLFVATITVLFAAIYILSQILSIALGAPASHTWLSDLGQALGFTIMGVAVWFYHGWALRHDGALAASEQADRLSKLTVAVVDVGQGRWGQASLHALHREWPQLGLVPVGLTPAAITAMQSSSDPAALLAAIRSAELIIGPWSMAAANDTVPPDMARAIASSPARKLLVPEWTPGWEWIGVDRYDEDELVSQTLRAFKQTLEGVEVRPARSALTVWGILAGVILILFILLTLIPVFVNSIID